VIENLNLESYVHLYEPISNIHAKMKEADLYLLTSNHEGLPNALMEAAAIGLPCISTDCAGGGARSIIFNGKNGILVDVGDVDGICDAMILLVNSIEDRKKIGEEAKKCKEKYSKENVIQMWHQYLENKI